MNTDNLDNEGWLTLQEAADLLGCSARTIRRRFEDGTFDTKIEYRGKQMIRLVSKKDVLKAAGKVRISEIAEPSSPEGARALSVTLGALTDSIQRTLDRRIDSLGRRILILSFLMAGLMVGAVFIFVNRQADKLAGKIDGVRVVLSGGMSELKGDLSARFDEFEQTTGAKLDSFRNNISEELKWMDRNREDEFKNIRLQVKQARQTVRDTESNLVLTRMQTSANKSRVSELKGKLDDLQQELEILRENIARTEINTEEPNNDRKSDSEQEPDRTRLEPPEPAENRDSMTEIGTETIFSEEENQKSRAGANDSIPGLAELLRHYRPAPDTAIPLNRR